jgi:hypothetical protein
MKEDESLCKVETRNGVLYLFVQWLGDELTEFDVTISDGSLIWRANGRFIVLSMVNGCLVNLFWICKTFARM